MRKEAKEFRLKKVLDGSDHKSQSMKLTYLHLPDPIDVGETHWNKLHMGSQIFGRPDNGAPYFDMHRFLNDYANGEVNLPAPLIELLSSDINKISKQFSEEVQKGFLDNHYSNGKTKQRKVNQRDLIKNNDNLPKTKQNKNNLIFNNGFELQGSECVESKLIPENMNIDKKKSKKWSKIFCSFNYS